ADVCVQKPCHDILQSPHRAEPPEGQSPQVDHEPCDLAAGIGQCVTVPVNGDRAAVSQNHVSGAKISMGRDHGNIAEGRCRRYQTLEEALGLAGQRRALLSDATCSALVLGKDVMETPGWTLRRA